LKERLVTLGLALAALAVFYVIFVPKPNAGAASAVPPTSVEPGPDGYLAAWRWLEAARIPVVSLREHYDRLNSNSAVSRATSGTAVGNVLLTTLPQKLPADAREAAQLDRWVERGNTLVVMAAFDDTPLWTVGDLHLVEAAGRFTRLQFAVIEDEPPQQTAPRQSLGTALRGMLQTRASTLEPRGSHALLEGVRAVSVVSDLPASRWRASPMDRSGVLQIGRIAGTGDPALWLRRQGNGQVITFAVASIFSNRLLGTGDNARLLSNLIAWSRSSAGAVIFDDAHQGLVSYYDAKAFFADPRLYRTLSWIVLLWLVFVLGVQRLRTRRRAWSPADVTAFIGTSGEFFAATVTPADTAARLFANFFNSLRRRLNLREDGAPLWEWLSAQAGMRAGDLAELRRLHERIGTSRRVDLMRLQNLLSRLQGILA
jgi:hypothetical protein